MADASDDAGKLLGPLEAEVMRVLWQAGEPLTVRGLLGELNSSRRPQLAYTTVMTVMNRLTEKGALRRERRGRGFVYEPTADSPAGIAVQNVVRDFGDAAVAQFVDQARADPELLGRLERLLDAERDET
jgi:predicted transcriptional regulator